MLRLVVLILSLSAYSITSSLASEIEDLETAAPTKEALIIQKPFIKDVKFPLPLPPSLGKHNSHFLPKLIHSLNEFPLPLRPLGVLNKKPDIPEDPKLVSHKHIPLLDPHILTEPKLIDDSKYLHPKHKNLLDALFPEPKLIGPEIHKHFSSVEPKLHQDEFRHVSPKKPLLFSEPHLGSHSLNDNEEHINILDVVAKKFVHPIGSKPHFPDDLVPGFLEPKPVGPLLPPPTLPPLDHKFHHDHPLHLLPKKPLPLPEPEVPLEPKIHHHPLPSLPEKPLPLPEILEPKIHEHSLHLLPKKPLPLPELLEPKIHHHLLHLLPKKPFPLPEPHLGEHIHKEHEKHIHSLDHHIFDGPKLEKKLPHLLHLEPHFPKHLLPDIVKPKPIGPFLPPPPPLEPKLHHHHPLAKKPLPLPKPHFGIHLQKEHEKPFEPKLVGNILPPPVFLPLDPKLHHDHSIHKAPKKPLLVPELDLEDHLLHNHGHEEHNSPIGPHIFLGSKSINEKKFPNPLDLKPYILEESVPEIVQTIKPKVVSKHVSKPLGPKLHHDHSEGSELKKPLFVPQPHLTRNLLLEQETSEIINSPDLSVTRSIPVYESTEEVETIK